VEAEGAAIAFADHAICELGGQVACHQRKGDAVVKVGGNPYVFRKDFVCNK
jgi:hypothetical protein